MDADPSAFDSSSVQGDRLGFGKMKFGCTHYRRRCMIRAPCCDDIFFCRHCHNDSTSGQHELPRHDVQRVVCLVCDTEQQACQVCFNCGVNMGEYYCDVCKFYDDDIEKGQYHCNDCGICRVGGKEQFFHCQKCGSCYSVSLRDKHLCVENSMKQDCPICYDYLFNSTREASVLYCGHTMHMECMNEMLKHKQYACPICMRLKQLPYQRIIVARRFGSSAMIAMAHQKFSFTFLVSNAVNVIPTTPGPLHLLLFLSDFFSKHTIDYLLIYFDETISFFAEMVGVIISAISTVGSSTLKNTSPPLHSFFYVCLNMNMRTKRAIQFFLFCIKNKKH